MFRKDVNKWLNAVGLVFASLSVSTLHNYCYFQTPEVFSTQTAYGEVIYDRLCDALNDPEMEMWLEQRQTFSKLNFEQQWTLIEDSTPCRLMALAHAVWLQASIGYLNILPQ